VRLAVSVTLAYAMFGSSAHAQNAQSSSSKDEVLEYVIVSGSQVELPPEYAGGQVARGGRTGIFGNLDVMDTPFNSTNYTADFMRNLQARSVADVVQSDPGVRVARGFGNFQELYVVRGFPVNSDDMSYNGLYGLLPRQYVAAEFLERVEVLRGANSFLNGAAPGGGNQGGSFNLVPKRAPNGGLNRASAGWENGSQAYFAGDFARRMGEGESFGIRANGVYRDGEMSVDRQDRELKMGSLGVDYRGDKLRFSADLGWQDHRINSPRPSVTPFGGIPRAPDASSNFAQDWTFSAEKDLFGVARGEYDFTPQAKLWAAIGTRESTEHNVLANPNSDAAGNTSSYRFDNYREDRVDTNEIGFRTEFSTGGVTHKVSTQGTTFKLDSKNAYALSDFFTGFANNLYSPTQVVAPPATFFTGGVLFDPKTTTEIKTSSVAIADTLGFAKDSVLLTLGARYQVLEQYSFDYNTGAELSGYDESAITPVVGLVYKPSDSVSLYANYIEGLSPGETAPVQVGTTLVTNAGKVFDPYQSKQYEIGAKYDRNTLGATLAVFRLSKPNLTLQGDVVTDSGETRTQGIEFTTYGQLTDGLKVLGGLTLLEATNEKTLDGLNNGKDVIGVPDTQVNLSLEWDVPGTNGLSVDARGTYTSSQAANEANTLSIPSWTRLDVGGRYALDLGNSKVVTLRARVDNVTDKNYWASVGGSFNANYMVLGGPRTYTLSASYHY
jgi:iron complex outermembrane receptor protein